MRKANKHLFKLTPQTKLILDKFENAVHYLVVLYLISTDKNICSII